MSPCGDSGNNGLYLSLVTSLGLPVHTAAPAVSLPLLGTLQPVHVSRSQTGKLFSEKLARAGLFRCPCSRGWGQLCGGGSCAQRLRHAALGGKRRRVEVTPPRGSCAAPSPAPGPALSPHGAAGPLVTVGAQQPGGGAHLRNRTVSDRCRHSGPRVPGWGHTASVFIPALFLSMRRQL